jgi:hypothetical protein
MIKIFKRADGFRIRSVIEHNKFHWLYEEVGDYNGEKLATSITSEPPKLSGEKPNLECKPKDGVFVESPKEPPKRAIWVEKPNHMRNKIDTLPDPPREHEVCEC